MTHTKGHQNSKNYGANARLIAAAPELLGFIKFLVYDGHLPSTCKSPADVKTCLKCMAIDLIARAEGK